ncbi:MAG TPA: HPF/RaiA family ribosome-associated protein [Kofleriaceae bacterium]|nr:HPF/RaiA family ribosome-associated protein [Kofleriaceae bacterium]
MQVPTEITFHGIEHSDAVEASIHRWIARLEHFHDRITGCGVVISQPHKRHRQGREFQISLRLEVPGAEIACTHAAHEDIYIAIADAFRAAKRQLQDHVDLQRGFVKTHVVERTGNVGLNLNKHRAGAASGGSR